MAFPVGAAIIGGSMVASSLLGGGSKGAKVVQTRHIPPASWQERALLGDLFNLAHYNYYRPSSYFLGVLQKHYEPSEEFLAEARNPYLSMLPYQEKWGQFLNQAAVRGIVNSSITQDAMKELGQALAERGRELRWQGLLAAEEARRLALADELKRAAMREDALRLSKDDRYNKLYRLWSALYSGRMGTPTVVTERSGGPSMFSQVAGSALGMGLGYWLGPGGGFSRLMNWQWGGGGSVGNLEAGAALSSATTATGGPFMAAWRMMSPFKF